MPYQDDIAVERAFNQSTWIQGIDVGSPAYNKLRNEFGTFSSARKKTIELTGQTELDTKTVEETAKEYISHVGSLLSLDPKNKDNAYNVGITYGYEDIKQLNAAKKYATKNYGDNKTKDPRISFDYGDDKINFFGKAYEDMFSGRKDSNRGEIPPSGVEELKKR
jgi:hypothetical protein